MSGFSALVTSAPSTMPTILKSMLGRMRHYEWLMSAEWTDPFGEAGLGIVTFPSLAVGGVAAVDGWTAVVHGEFFDDERVRGPAGSPAGSGPHDSPASRLLAGWRRDGAAFLRYLDGEFSAAIWDSGRRQMHVVTDRFGLRPTYVAQTTDTFGVASEVKSLLALSGVDSAWSDAGVAQFFSFGYFFNDQTLLRGVRAMPAATVGTYRADERRYEEATYWRPRVRPVTRPESAATDLEDAFAAAVAKRARPGERLGLSLSGGLDARTILGVMPADVDLQTVSLGIDGSLDHQSAGRLASIAGVRHHASLLDASFLSSFEQHLRRMVLLTDGHYLDQGIVMPSMHVYRDLGIEYLLRGHAGELLHMSKAYAFSLDAGALNLPATELEAWLFSHLTGYMLSGVPDDLFTIDVRGLARGSLRKALDRCEPVDRPVDVVWQLFLNERIHRETALSMHTFGCFTTVRQPYVDNAVIDAVFSLPAAAKLGDRLQTAILRHRRPAFLEVTNANTGARLGAGAAATALARLRLRVFAKLGVKGYQPYERLGLWLRRELRPLVESVVTAEPLLQAGLFRPAAVRRVATQHMTGEANHTFLLMSLLIFALGLELRRDPEAFSAGEPA
jgi:asparagine synthase (glutamine-hydrolysing)